MNSTMELTRLLALMAVMIIYLCVGAAVFNAIEGRNEKTRKEQLEGVIDNFLNNNTCVSRQDLHRLLFIASQDGELVYYILNNKTHLDRWDFSGAFGFSISVVTTIGFGNLAPYTMEGKALVVVYGLIGIPLMLVLLAGIGEKLVLVVKRINKFNFCSNKRPQVNRAINMGIIAFLGLMIGFILPATMFHCIEEWHFLESLYFCFTTLSTIGFGDYIIGIHETKITEGALHELYEVVAFAWILFGLAYVSLVIKYISDLLIHKANKMEQKTVRRLEGTRLFGKLSREESPSAGDATPSHKNSSVVESDDSRSLDPEVEYVTRRIIGDSPPPTYSIERISREGEEDQIVTRPSSVHLPLTRARSSSESGLYAHGADSSAVELLSVNYI